MKSPDPFSVRLGRALRIALALAFTLALHPAWSPAHGAEEAPDHDDHDEAAHDETIPDHDDEGSGGVVHLTGKQLVDFGVVVDVAGPVELSLGALLPGEVKLNRERMAHVSPRYDGIVTDISARLGDSVQAGQVLAVLESNTTLAPFEVSSPIEGTIVDFHITMGESVEAGRYLFIVADLTEVWVDLDIFQKDLGRVEKGQSVSVVAGRDELIAGGTIDYVGPVVREDTRTGLARVTLANPDGKWKAGMFVTCRVTTDTPAVPVAIRRSATQKVGGRTVAFVWTGDEFEPRALTLGRMDAHFVEVLSGIDSGERYVSERSFLLKAQLEKASIDPHAGHNH
ncbi:MAG: hypothetical protein DRP71_10810 [Verrucomicrobia bacterium]|nr:MAG: hypothetical protein DRP71_10810 [Verrucomicrobiota bacterium]